MELVLRLWLSRNCHCTALMSDDFVLMLFDVALMLFDVALMLFDVALMLFG